MQTEIAPSETTDTKPATPVVDANAGAILLNLGPGKFPLDGWTNLDIKDGHDCRDLSDYPDGTVDHIRASHVLEHSDRKDAIETVIMWAKKLKQGGSLSIAVPNLEWIANQYTSGNADQMLEAYLLGGQTDKDDYHKSAWDKKKMRALLTAAGLGAIRPWYTTVDDCARLPVSLNLRATKLPCDLSDVKLSMTMPRHSFTRAGMCLHVALRELKVDLHQNQGVFWHHGLDRLFCEAVKANCEWILTADYDTMFDSGNVLHLLDLADQYKLDAVFPLQVQRNAAQAVLARLEDDDGQPRVSVPISELQEPIIKAATGHFGLTLIRVEALKRVPTPWFLGHPNAAGHYGDGRIDDDIHFWHQWKAAGNKLWMANDCVVGHLQEVVSWPTKDYTVQHQYTYDYDKEGKPHWSR